jgi:hypothetical protein
MGPGAGGEAARAHIGASAIARTANTAVRMIMIRPAVAPSVRVGDRFGRELNGPGGYGQWAGGPAPTSGFSKDRMTRVDIAGEA